MSKLINVNCLHFIGCQNYTNVLINRVLYQIQVTALLPFFLRKLHLALTAVKDHVMKYSETAFSNSNVNYFWSIKNSSEVIEKLRLRNFQGSQVSSFDFSTLYISLPHDLIKAKVLSLVNWCFNRESKSYLCTSLKAILQVLIFKALYDKSYLGSKNNYDFRWMDMLDFICNGSVDLFGTGRERKIQNENICLQRDSNPRPRQSTTGKLQRLRPLGHEGLMMISGWMSSRIMGYKF